MGIQRLFPQARAVGAAQVGHMPAGVGSFQAHVHTRDTVARQHNLVLLGPPHGQSSLRQRYRLRGLIAALNDQPLPR